MASLEPSDTHINEGTDEKYQDHESTFDSAGASSGVYNEKSDVQIRAGKGQDVANVPLHGDAEEGAEDKPVVATAEDLVTQVLEVKDDPSLNPWTFRVFFWGAGLSVFGGVLQQIFMFKPQIVSVSLIFMVVISYVGCNIFDYVIPRKGFIGRWLNPHRFNSKEHCAIVIMVNSATNAAMAWEVIAAQRLFYPSSPNAASSIFLMFSSQLIGYGFAGCLRKILVYPTKMLYPMNLPINNILEALHQDKSANKKRLVFFWSVFAAIFVWEVFPEYIMPILTGISIFCLAKRDSMVFTNLFGGTNGNEGLGLFSLCFDWQYVGAGPLYLPLQTLTNNFVGYVGCIALFMGLYYANTWRAKDFPFLSQLLYDGTLSNGTSYVTYNQTLVLNDKFELDETKLQDYGLPYMSSTYLSTLITGNMAVTAGIVHLLLWNFSDLKSGWSFIQPGKLREYIWSPKKWYEDRGTDEQGALNDPLLDPHYKLMVSYKDVPNWWYGLVLLASFIISMVVIYTCHSTLPWWGLVIALVISYIFILFFGALYAMTGFSLPTQPIVQLIGAYCHPGRPLANMYFTLYGYNSSAQGYLLLRDLKLAQEAHLSPCCTFAMQISGTLIGVIFNYIMMDSILRNQREVLLSIEGTNIWSGQAVQMFNSLAIAWGGLAKHLFSVGGRYQWVSLSFLLGIPAPLPFYFLHRRYPKVGFSYFITPILIWYLCWLCVGINSSILSFFVIGATSQFYLRRYKTRWFIKYNYLLSAALDGGTQVMVFILTFAVLGGAGKARKFPPYWGNHHQQDGAHYDYCASDPRES